MKNNKSYGIVYLPPKDATSSGTKILMPIAKKKVFDCFYFKGEQPTYEEAEKELGIVKSCIYHHIKQLEKLGLCKIGKRGIIKWTLEDF